MLAGDLPQHFDAVHARHVDIERDHVRVQLVDFLQPDGAIHGGADDFDGRIALQHLRDQLAHQRRIVDHQHADFLAHAMAPTAGIRERCETTAETFKIKTTVPSPRIEAPLTIGEVISSSSSALMTSSSSPIRLSTARPKRRAPAPMTTTNVRLASFVDLTFGFEAFEAHQREDLFAQLEDFMIVHAVHIAFGQAGNFHDGRNRHGVEAAGHVKQERLNAGERERNHQAEGGAFADFAFDLDVAFQIVEGGFHHVESDAAAGNFSDFVGGAEAGSKKQIVRFGFVEAAAIFFLQDAALDRRANHFFAIDAAAIVHDFDHDLIALVIGVERYRAARGFSGSGAFGGGFDAVVGGIADQMRERLGERVQNAFVEIGVLPGNFQGDILVAQLGHVANHAREAAE